MSTQSPITSTAIDARPRLRVVNSSRPSKRAVKRRDPARRVGLVGHAGLASTRVGCTPTRASLGRALRLGVDALEIDVCATADYELVLHHDSCLAVGLPISDLTLTQLRRVAPTLLTLDDAADIVGHRARLIVDVKTRAAAGPVADWFSRSATTPDAAVCTARRDVLRYLSHAAPRVPLWQTFPDLGERPYQRVLHVLTNVAAHRGRSALQLVGDLWDVLGRVRTNRAHAALQFIGLPWRRRLPELMARVRGEFDAAGVAVHHALVTPDLCAVAHELDLTVVAWTVNSAAAARHAASCGVDLITTDDIAGMRRALRSRRTRP